MVRFRRAARQGMLFHPEFDAVASARVRTASVTDAAAGSRQAVAVVVEEWANRRRRAAEHTIIQCCDRCFI